MQYLKPSRKLLRVWQLRTVAGAIVPAVLTSLFFDPLSVVWNILTAIWALSLAFCIAIYLPLRYLSTSYRVDERTVEINRGVLNLTSKIVLLRNVEFITLESAPDERLAGLCSISLFVVGGRVLLSGLTVDEARLLSAGLPGGSRFEAGAAQAGGSETKPQEEAEQA